MVDVCGILEAFLAEGLGSGETIESLCARHPRHEIELRGLWRRYTRAANALDEVGPAALEGANGSPETRHPETRYQVRGEVARGGMGGVLQVWDRELRRTLAMKVLGTRSSPRLAGRASGVGC